MNERKLLIDYIPFQVSPQLVNESLERNNGKLIVSGILQRANAKNQNGRIYPRSILEKEAQRYLKEKVKERRATGELDHPDRSVVNLGNVSHLITDLKWSNDDLYGTVEVLNTPAGKILKELFRAGVKVGISSRGLGSVERTDEGVDSVQDDFELIAWDFVSDPSTINAFMSPINESKNGEIKKTNKKIHEIINEIIYNLK